MMPGASPVPLGEQNLSENASPRRSALTIGETVTLREAIGAAV
jgi:hypothetical protein